MFNARSITDGDYKYIFEELIDMSDDGFLLVNSDGTIININEAYAEHLGLAREDIIHKHVTKIIRNTGMINIMENDRRDMNLIAVINHFEIMPDTSERLILVNRSPVKNASKEIIASVAQVRFRQQVLSHANSFNEYYRVLSVYDKGVLGKVSSKKQFDEEKDYVKKLLLQIDYYKNELQRMKEKKVDYVIGTSPKFLEAKTAALKAAKNPFTVLITGETGTGKEIMANLIHWVSNRAEFPFIVVNCAAIPSELFESELFGYERGAFTGALRGGKKGKFERAHRGTLFLDEIGELPLNMQTKLLRVLQDGIIEPLGSLKPVPVDVRIIAATNIDLEEMIRQKKFREDLYYRLNEVKINIPRLSDRKCDIVPLAQHSLNKLNWEYDTSKIISPEVLECLRNYSWPGNIRQLNNVVKSSYSKADDREIEVFHLPEEITSYPVNRSSQNNTLMNYLNSCEKNYIIRSLEKNKCNLSVTAKSLGIHRSNLYEKIKKYHIDKADLRSREATAQKS